MHNQQLQLQPNVRVLLIFFFLLVYCNFAILCYAMQKYENDFTNFEQRNRKQFLLTVSLVCHQSFCITLSVIMWRKSLFGIAKRQSIFFVGAYRVISKIPESSILQEIVHIKLFDGIGTHEYEYMNYRLCIRTSTIPSKHNSQLYNLTYVLSCRASASSSRLQFARPIDLHKIIKLSNNHTVFFLLLLICHLLLFVQCRSQIGNAHQLNPKIMQRDV